MKKIILSIAAFVSLNFELCFCACAHAEYEIQGECCPMCAPGNRVYWHCTVDTSTTCVPCLKSTFTDEPNGLMNCFPCSVCSAIKRLREKNGCTRTADVICEPQEGFYCIDQNKHSCKSAVEHTKCSPGQYIKQPGTTFTDTICANCSDSTYSNGTLLACQPHTKCDTKGLTEIKAGTTSTDAECRKSTSVALIVGVVLLIIAIMTLCIGLYWILKRKNVKRKTTNDYAISQVSENDLEPRTPD